MLSISPIPAFQDNYIWMIKNEEDNTAFVVDPGDASPVLETLGRENLTLAGILITHHHFDHIDGIDELLAQHKVPVYGPKNPAIKQIDHRLSEGDTIQVYDVDFEIIEIPGHTLDHIAYYSKTLKTPILFCGDTLFVAGCGRVFEGTHGQMHTSLNKLGSLPASTQVYCTHEYTMANLRFAHTVDKTNPALRDYIFYSQHLRDMNMPTVPSSIEMELAINPFMRSDQPTIKEAAEKHSNQVLNTPEEVFQIIRSWKDSF